MQLAMSKYDVWLATRVSRRSTSSHHDQRFVRRAINSRKRVSLCSGDEVIGYDDLQSLELKVNQRLHLSLLTQSPRLFVLSDQINYAKEHRLGGVVIYPVNFDDSSGQSCNQGKFPMVTLVKRLTSNYTVSCVPLTTPPLNTTTAPKNRTKIITPKWKLPRPEYIGSGLPLNKHPRKAHNHASASAIMYPLLALYLIVSAVCHV